MPVALTTPNNSAAVTALRDRLSPHIDAQTIALARSRFRSSTFIDLLLPELLLFGPGVIALLAKHDIALRGVDNVPMRSVSPTLADQPEPPPSVLGLFVPKDRTLYIRRPERGVLAHETGHCISFALACEAGYADHDDPCISTHDADLRPMLQPQHSVTAYGRTSREEHLAEAIRAYCCIGDGSGLYATVSSQKLRGLNRPLFAYLLATFTRLNGRRFEALRFFN